MKYSYAQQMMIDDGCPPVLIMTKEQRHALWDANPPKGVPSFYDPRIEKDRELREAHKREATALRIFALRKSKGLIDDVTTGGEDMAEKYVIKPLDKHGHPVMWAVTSVAVDATPEQIDEKVLSAVERGGSKVVAVTLNNTLREVILAWAVDENGEVGPTDVEAFKIEAQEAPDANAPGDVTADAATAPAEATQTTEVVGKSEESNMTAKKAKSKKSGAAKAPRKAKVAGEVRKGSKTEIVANLLKRKNGCTSAEILAATKWPAVSVPACAKAAGLKLRKEKIKGEVTRYFGS